MKKFTIFLSTMLLAALLAGCAGTPVVYYTECNCSGSQQAGGSTQENIAEGALSTGLAIVGSTAESKDGEVSYDVTVAAVTLDVNGVITDCIIDSVGAKVAFDANGQITTDLTAPVSTKNELGDSYGMKAYGGAKYEWYEQAAALADFAVGKTVDELKNGAVDQTGKAPQGSDLASTATIYLGGYVAAIEKAAANAKALGSMSGDELKLAVNCTLGSSVSATADKAGTAQLDVDVAVLTADGQTITGCYLDSLQAKVGFDAAGKLTGDVTAPLQTKNELGEAYGMKAWGGAKYEWNEQAANFAAYVTGKTAAQVAGIAVTETTAPAEADLASGVTIAIGGFQALLAKAMQ